MSASRSLDLLDIFHVSLCIEPRLSGQQQIRSHLAAGVGNPGAVA